MSFLWHGLRDAFLMAWEVWWALVFGFLISAVVQAWVPREHIEQSLAGSGPGPLVRSTGLGAVSSSCSYAAVAISRSLFEKGASVASALAFQIASTNLVWELGLLLWVLLGWQFTLGEYLGGIATIAVTALLVRPFVPHEVEERARDHARHAATTDDRHHDHHHRASGDEAPPSRRLTSAGAWSALARSFRGDWQMLYKEIGIGFLLSGYVAQVPAGVLHSLFLSGAPAPLHTLADAVIGPIIAMLSFVCSVGNVPLAAVLWSGGIGFAGVMAFILADLIVLPILAIYRKYYGLAFAVRISALMLVAMVAAALIVDAAFGAAGLIPAGVRPTHSQIFGPLAVNYKLFLNLGALAVFSTLMCVTARRSTRAWAA